MYIYLMKMFYLIKYKVKSEEKMKALPGIKIGSKSYFVDERLNELRNCKNPNDTEKMEGSTEFYVQYFGVK